MNTLQPCLINSSVLRGAVSLPMAVMLAGLSVTALPPSALPHGAESAIDAFFADDAMIALPEDSVPQSKPNPSPTPSAAASASAGARPGSNVRIDPADFKFGPADREPQTGVEQSDSSVFLATGWTGPDSTLQEAIAFRALCVNWLERKAAQLGRDVFDMYSRFVLAQHGDDALKLSAALDAVAAWDGVKGCDADSLHSGLAPLAEAAKSHAVDSLQLAHMFYLDGLLHAMTGRSDAAISHHEHALRLAPYHDLNGRALHGLHGMRGDTGSQIRVGLVLLRARIGDHHLLLHTARLLDEAGQANEALALCSEFPELVIPNPELAIYRVQLMKKSGLPSERLIEAFEPTFRAHQDDLAVGIFHLVLLDAVNRLDEVASGLDKAIGGIDPGQMSANPVLANHVSTLIALAERSGHPEKAARLLAQSKDRVSPSQ